MDEQVKTGSSVAFFSSICYLVSRSLVGMMQNQPSLRFIAANNLFKPRIHRLTQIQSFILSGVEGSSWLIFNRLIDAILYFLKSVTSVIWPPTWDFGLKTF